MKKRYLITSVEPIKTTKFTMNVAELYNHLPRNIKHNVKRIYWITKPIGEKCSGDHAHSDKENELFVILQGTASVVLDSDGQGKETFPLKANKVVWIPRMVWHRFINMSDDCIILALTSTNYDPERKGYVRDYDNFRKMVVSKDKK